MNKKIKGRISITKPTGIDGERINIAIVDNASLTEFIDLEMSLEDFAKAITGQGYMPIEGEVRNLENVGKQRESKELVFEMPEGCGYRDSDLAAELCQRHTDKGWTARASFNSQDSFFTKDGKRWARTTQFRYLD